MTPSIGQRAVVDARFYANCDDGLALPPLVIPFGAGPSPSGRVNGAPDRERSYGTLSAGGAVPFTCRHVAAPAIRGSVASGSVNE